MAWLTGYSHRISHNLTGATGAGTDYQILIAVHEGAGSDDDYNVYLDGRCTDFPYDVAFTDDDEVTELIPALISITGTSPNRLAIFRVPIADSLESGTVPIYLYCGKSNHTPTFDPATTFPFYGKLGAQNYEWVADTGEEFTEHSVIYGGYLYVPACDYTNSNGGVKKYSVGGELQATYAASYYTQSTPILFESGGSDYMIIYDIKNCYIRRFALSAPDTPTHSVDIGNATHYMDIEGMAWDTGNDRVIAPIYTSSKWYLRSFSMSDLSAAWSYELDTQPSYNTGSFASPLIVGSYVYFYDRSTARLHKIALSDGSGSSTDIGDGTVSSTYASPIYDEDNNRILCLAGLNKVCCVDPSDMSIDWTHTFAAGAGSDTDYVTYTGLTTPYIKGTLAYYNGKLFVGIREENAGATQYHAKLYAVDVTTGYDAWVNTADMWTDGIEIGNSMLLTDTHIVLAGIDYDYSATNYHIGTFYVLKQSDGTLVYKGALPWGAMCGGATQAYGGRVFFCMENGLVCSVKLGWGTEADSLHFGKNAYHTGHTANLEIDTSLTFSTRSATITGWTEDGGTSIDAEGFGMRLKEHANHYAHVEKAASALANFVVETRVYVLDTNIGGTWAPHVFAYWDTNDWAAMGLGWFTAPYNYSFRAIYNKAGTLTEAWQNPGTGAIKTWYWIRVRADASNVYFDYSTDYINWTTRTSTARAATWAGAPSLVIVGKGTGGWTGYPNADLDNNYATAGTESTMHFLDVWQRKYAATEPTHGAWGEWETSETPTAITQPESNLGATTVRINGQISDDGGETCYARFRWRVKV